MNHALAALLDRFSARRVVLVGDFMLDRYLVGDAERISPEAPVPVLRIVERQDRAGGAGSVALNIAALGASVQCFGLVGRDADGERLRQLLGVPGVGADGLLAVDDRPTITKTRLVGLAEHRHRQQMLRVDDELIRPPARADEEHLVAAITAALPTAEIVCLEDYAKGLLTRELCGSVIAAARGAGLRVAVDPARTGDYERYRGASVLTPNLAELELAVGRRVTREELAAETLKLIQRFDFEAVIVTLGRDGALLVDSSGRSRHFPTRPRAVYDNTGAGDAVLATAAVALAAGGSLDDAVVLANIAGGLEVSKFGCVPIQRDEVLAELHAGGGVEHRKIRATADVATELSARRARGETIVFTNGCFDVLHPGHVRLLTEAKAQGSVLVVGVNSDDSVRALEKGSDRPIRGQRDRMLMLAALEAVDYVVMFDEADPGRLIEVVAPDVLVKGGDWRGKRVVGQEFVESRGGRVVLVDLLAGYSTTGELERIRGATGANP